MCPLTTKTKHFLHTNYPIMEDQLADQENNDNGKSIQTPVGINDELSKSLVVTAMANKMLSLGQVYHSFRKFGVIL